MRSMRSTRLTTPGDQAQYPNTRAAPALVPPSTPHQPKSGAALNQLLLSLERKWQLDLEAGEHQSPAQIRTTAGKAKQKIQYLFFSSRPALDDALRRFEKAAKKCPHNKQLDLLDGLLRDQLHVPSPLSRTATPVSTRNQPPKSLLSTPQLPQSRGRLRDRETGYDRATAHAAAVDPGSPTDVDTDDEFASRRSASPSPSIRSSNRRLKASLPVPVRANHRKRTADTSDLAGHSAKLTKTIKGKQPAGPPAAVPMKTPDTSKNPASYTARSVPAPAQSFSSVNTLWSTTANSSQETNATSFNTTFEVAKHDHVAPLDRESTSTYGSIDEDVLLEKTRQADHEDNPIRSFREVSAPAHKPTPAHNSAPGRTTTVETHNPAPERNMNADSPSKLPYYIRELPTQNLFVDFIPARFLKIPFFLLFICCRISLATREPIGNVLEQLGHEAVPTSANMFWDALGSKFQSGRVEGSPVWAAARKSFEGFTFKGSVNFSPMSASSVFRLDLSPIEADRSCQLQRMFGSDRFLYLAFPSFSENKPSHLNKTQMSQIEQLWKLWLVREHSFLGRKWRVFHIEPTKRKNTQRQDNGSDKRIVLFATGGLGISEISVGTMLDTFMPLNKNQKQNYCKAYARLDLALSRTTPTLVFKPSQIRRIPDKRGDGTPEATEFNDPNLNWSERCRPQVMNDGCARISVGAALKVWDMYRRVTGSDEAFPSAFQGRIRGAKGMWMVSAEAHTRDQAHLDVWIEISDSQSKFEPTEADESDATYNAHRLTFNHVQHSSVNGSTDLHISFIPALVERGVEKAVIANLMNKHLDMERKQLLEMLTEPVKLHNWVTKQGSAAPVSGILQWQAALPVATAERVKFLLRAGFTPQESPYLAKTLTKLVNQQQAVVEQKLRAPLGSATYLYGLADPENVLEPGEVHISFSSPFIDEFSRQTYRHLDGLEILVARQPACRRSDVQKVRAIAHPKLTHLRDVIVFPVRGEYPLAGKLQGGDYDGDTFWICWDSILVEPFKNAPAPLNPPEHINSYIKKDNRALNQVMDTRHLSSIDGFLREAFDFRLTTSLLGKATVFHEKVAYEENEISSERIDALCDLHDLLVDAPKQAYMFKEEDFKRLVWQKLKCGNPRDPAYKLAMNASKNNRDIGESDKMTSEDYNYNPHNILDYLYFDVIRKHNIETRRQLNDKLPKEREDDPVLQLPYIQLKGVQNKALQTELRALLQGFARIERDWNSGLGDKSPSSIDRYGRLLDQCYDSFCSLYPSPANSSDPEVARLLFPYCGTDRATLWEVIRASAFYTEYPKKHVLVWQMAGRELARLKAGGNAHTYNVVPAIFADMKAKPHKMPKLDADESDDELESALDRIT